MSPIYVPGKVTLRQTWQPMDPDAAAYITAVETADGQALEEKVKIAIDNFVLGCKADGIWSAIKASCILAGARTLNGALVPLVGTAPTNYNFVAGDYNRETGLVGDGSTKYLDSGLPGNSPPLDNIHGAVYQTSGSTGVYLMGNGTSSTSTIQINNNTQPIRLQSSIFLDVGIAAATPFVGIARSSSTAITSRRNKESRAYSYASNGTIADNVLLFSRGTASVPNGISACGIAFYSIGESLDLALLDARVTDLINAIGVAIP